MTNRKGGGVKAQETSGPIIVRPSQSSCPRDRREETGFLTNEATAFFGAAPAIDVHSLFSRDGKGINVTLYLIRLNELAGRKIKNRLPSSKTGCLSTHLVNGGQVSGGTG